MRHALLILGVVPSLLFAQAPQPIPIRRLQPANEQIPADSLPGNFEFKLTITEKDAEPVELSVVVSSTRFTAQLGDPALSFSGTVTLDDSGNLSVSYALGWETMITVNSGVQFKPTSIQGSVRIKPGEEVQIIRAKNRTARLQVKKLDSAQKE